MIESFIILFCLPLAEPKMFRDFNDLAHYSNFLTIQHYPDEIIFDIKDVAKSNADENCYWISIEPY